MAASSNNTMDSNNDSSGGKYEEPDYTSLKGKRVLITGASSGFGEEMAYQYAGHGARLALTARREALLKQVVSKCNKLSGKEIHSYIVADMAQLEEPSRVVKVAIETMGGIDLLVLNHGLIPDHKYWKGTREDLEETKYITDVNYLSFLYMTAAATETLIKNKGGLFVMSSIAGRLPAPFIASYTATKHALDGFYETLRFEWAQQNIDIPITIGQPTYTKTGRIVEAIVGCKQMENGLAGNPDDPDVFGAVDDTVAVMIRAQLQKRESIQYGPKEELIGPALKARIDDDRGPLNALMETFWIKVPDMQDP